MTEMVHGARAARPGDPVLPRWWRSVDSWSIAAVVALCAIGLLLGFAASPPLAERNGHEPFHYVIRQFAFGGLSLTVMVLVSMMSPTTVRRLGVLGFIAGGGALMLLPIFGTDYGQGAVRWYSLGFASVQPSEFLKPRLRHLHRLDDRLEPRSTGRRARPCRLPSPHHRGLPRCLQPDFGQAALIVFAWSVIYFVAGAPMLLLRRRDRPRLAPGSSPTLPSISPAASTASCRREVDPNTQLAFATDAIREGGLFRRGVGEGSGQMDAARCPYRFHHRRGGRGIRADLVLP
jgi:cell division protein FtsW